MIYRKPNRLPRLLLKRVLCICKSVHGEVPYAYNHLSFIQCILHEIFTVVSFFFSLPPPPPTTNSEIHRSERMLNTKSVKVHDSLWQNSHSFWIKYIWWNSNQACQYVHKWDCWFPRRDRYHLFALWRPLCINRPGCYLDMQNISASARSWTCLLNWERDWTSHAKVTSTNCNAVQLLL